LGVLDVQMSLATVDVDISRSRRQTILASVILVLSVLSVTGFLIFTLIRAPVHRLTEGTRAIALGNLDYTIPLQRKDEIGELANSFNTMTGELKRAREELERIQSHLIQMEKMASLGKLSASVAHELNNPLSGTLTYIKLIQRKLSSLQLPSQQLSYFKEKMSLIAEETSRCGNIVKNLLLFSKKQIGEFVPVDLHQILDRCNRLVEHHLKLNKVSLNKAYQKGNPLIICDRDQIQQCILAILDNAVAAMPKGGTITVKTSFDSNSENVRVEIQDTGLGISSTDLPHIFEPFYTTKKDGKGVGLGLSVCYGILTNHNGKIDAKSTLGGGSTFIIELPLFRADSEKSFL